VSPEVLDEQLVWLCRAAVRSTGTSSCGVTMLVRGGQSVTAHASEPQAQAVEDLQHTLGEGPGVEATESGAAVLARDLVDLTDPTLERWPTFARESAGLGVRAAFAFPLLLGSHPIGAISFYRAAPGGLDAEQVIQGWVTADAVAQSLVDPSERLPAPSEHTDPMQVHQAAGMVTVQLDVPIDQALLRMRATAYAEGQTVDQLADAIVRRRRRLVKEDT
jgi:hypothetical protein